MAAYWGNIRKEYKSIVSNLKKYGRTHNDDQTSQNQEESNDADNFGFFLLVASNSFSISQIWRVPELAYESRGGAFFILYSIALLTIANATLYLEVALGQYLSKSAITAYKLVPVAAGLAFSCIVYSLIFLAYQSIFIAFSVHYFMDTFTNPLFWSKCRDPLYGKATAQFSCQEIDSCKLSNVTSCEFPSKYYWSKVVTAGGFLDETESGEIIGTLIMALVIAWVVIYLKMLSAPNLRSKFGYFTFALPYIIFVPLLYTGLREEKIGEGFYRLIVPSASDFLNIRTWALAIEQALISLGLGSSLAITFGSRCKFHSPSQIDCTISTCINLYNSYLSSIVIFTNIAILARDTGVPFYQTVLGGPGLVFITLSEAMKFLPFRTLFTLAFFFYLMTVLVNNCAIAGRALVKMIMEVVPAKNPPEFVSKFLLSLVCFGIAVPTMTKGGFYYFQTLNVYCVGYAVGFIVALELAVVAGLYGLKRFSDDAGFMLIHCYPSKYYRILWGISAVPVIMAAFTNVTTEAFHYTPNWTFVRGICGIVMILAPFWIVACYCVVNHHRKNLDVSYCFRRNTRHAPEGSATIKERRQSYKMCTPLQCSCK